MSVKRGFATVLNATPSITPTSTSTVTATHTVTQKVGGSGILSALPSGFKIGGVGVNWKRSEIEKLYHTPLLTLIFNSSLVHRQFQPLNKIQLCTLLNIKTGGCTEDCKYCSQSSRHKTQVKASRLIELEPVLKEARRAKENGSTRFCMGAAWRDLGGRKSGFERILKMVQGVRELDMEVCATLGMLSPEQAMRLKEAGLTAYNHNLDTSREFYPQVITTRSYDERLATIEAVQKAGIKVCSGGILGLGEEAEDRIGLIWEMSKLQGGKGPESFPVNALVAIEGTPLEKNEPVKFQDILRTIATARIVLPHSIIRFAAGRTSYSESEQAMSFLAGCNAIFTGERMLTTPTNGWEEDKEMLGRWGLEGMESFEFSKNSEQDQHHHQLGTTDDLQPQIQDQDQVGIEGKNEDGKSTVAEPACRSKAHISLGVS